MVDNGLLAFRQRGIWAVNIAGPWIIHTAAPLATPWTRSIWRVLQRVGWLLQWYRKNKCPVRETSNVPRCSVSFDQLLRATGKGLGRRPGPSTWQRSKKGSVGDRPENNYQNGEYPTNATRKTT